MRGKRWKKEKAKGATEAENVFIFSAGGGVNVRRLLSQALAVFLSGEKQEFVFEGEERERGKRGKEGRSNGCCTELVCMHF